MYYNQIIVDPHTATALKISNYQDYKNKQIFVLETAHYCKFPIAIKKSLNKEIDFPNFLNINDSEEKFEVIENDIHSIKNYILSKI